MCLALANFFNCFINFIYSFSLKTWKRTLIRCAQPGIFFLRSGVLNLGCFSFEDSDDEPSSVSESSDESLSLSPSDSSEDELYFLFLDPLSFF